jgi:hypothetical protein
MLPGRRPNLAIKPLGGATHRGILRADFADEATGLLNVCLSRLDGGGRSLGLHRRRLGRLLRDEVALGQIANPLLVRLRVAQLGEALRHLRARSRNCSGLLGIRLSRQCELRCRRFRRELVRARIDLLSNLKEMTAFGCHVFLLRHFLRSVQCVPKS